MVGFLTSVGAMYRHVHCFCQIMEADGQQPTVFRSPNRDQRMPAQIQRTSRFVDLQFLYRFHIACASR